MERIYQGSLFPAHHDEVLQPTHKEQERKAEITEKKREKGKRLGKARIGWIVFG